MQIRNALYLATIFLFFGCLADVPPNKCELVISSIESSHVITHKGLTFNDRIDSLIGKKVFSAERPWHDNEFTSCFAARKQADSDFLRLKPQIIQLNSFGGNMPYENEVYEQLLGLYVQNTGCTLLPFTDCYNDRTWTLLDHFYGADIRSELDRIVSRRSCLAIDSGDDKLVQATAMPAIQTQDTVVMSGGQPLLCSCYKMTYGTFNVEVSLAGTAKVLNYQEGLFDEECQNGIVKYLETTGWTPAKRHGKPFKSIVSVQLANF